MQRHDCDVCDQPMLGGGEGEDRLVDGRAMGEQWAWASNESGGLGEVMREDLTFPLAGSSKRAGHSICGRLLSNPPGSCRRRDEGRRGREALS